MRPAFLFDLDGVIFDTEGQYSVLWDEIGKEHFSDSGFAGKIKGQTLVRIFDLYFKDNLPLQEEIRDRLYRLEREMDYRYVPGVEDFLSELKSAGYPAAVVTSSNRDKMENVYRAHPDFSGRFARIFTGEDFTRSKPAPDCYLLGMKTFGTAPEDTFIFEDSFSGLQAARTSGGNVIALATTNPREAVAPYASLVIDDFRGLTAGMLWKK
ncbi:MAG: HAD family hydrolase [Bacteroidetes bacterium]|uniref:HAD family hydrolase n=1 Tax=Candidatus Cryptobacteroides gallistercoris TaxID=2840765 RepID=A0A940DN60_9BACT|nr:HAD family hydrolase [Candidatus Cryptobacteroides gallistercoris]